jgi:agmatinase
LDYGNFWQKGIYMTEISEDIISKSHSFRAKAIEAIKLLQSGANEEHPILKKNIEAINKASNDLNNWVYDYTTTFLNDQKKVILLGGDHSTPYGYIKALAAIHESFGILQIDAHCDLRNAYEGFQFSHASVMFNAIQLQSVQSLTQVGIRDFCEDELSLSNEHIKPIHIFFDRTMNYKRSMGASWQDLCQEIIDQLPPKIYISFDIDGLKPYLCPNTGTPVPGGLEVDEVFMLFNMIKAKGIQIIGADLNEVGNDLWDANVGARVLYRLCGLLMS